MDGGATRIDSESFKARREFREAALSLPPREPHPWTPALRRHVWAALKGKGAVGILQPGQATTRSSQFRGSGPDAAPLLRTRLLDWSSDRDRDLFDRGGPRIQHRQTELLDMGSSRLSRKGDECGTVRLRGYKMLRGNGVCSSEMCAADRRAVLSYDYR
ncbi:predicted protein [Uncinocarpus reesii 1704]|uniref:Uncharacterized protein n=1 Tax=Uncinocarpus reesii (strain UAMH 1704) TaxID=336963 RepID=C4JQE7_UNCRE|nr:uncharacterized protein UREG_04701 [Uncinocarpus reesii 1704]EEP79855.1 predicted protein [Uncinocarpus reesii 1704]